MRTSAFRVRKKAFANEVRSPRLAGESAWYLSALLQLSTYIHTFTASSSDNMDQWVELEIFAPWFLHTQQRAIQTVVVGLPEEIVLVAQQRSTHTYIHHSRKDKDDSATHRSFTLSKRAAEIASCPSEEEEEEGSPTTRVYGVYVCVTSSSRSVEVCLTLLCDALELLQGPLQQQSQLVVVAPHRQLQAAAGQLHVVLQT